MPYEPLHHKYRPQKFADLVGQEAIATTLTNAILTAKIAPAYLFTGPRGTGKTSSARILAKSLNCLKENKPTAQPCGVCDVCKGIAKGSALDVIEIDAASNTGVDHIRELIEKAQFAPVQCRYKVYVIDECLSGDSLVLTSKGVVRIDDPKIKGRRVLSYNGSLREWEFKKVIRWLDQGKRQTLVIKTTNREIRCTANHLIRTETGWVQAKNLTQGMRILSPVSVDVVNSYPNSERTDAEEDLPLVTKLKDGHRITKKYTIPPLFLPKSSHYVPYVSVAVGNYSMSLSPYSEGKAQELEAFSRIGRTIRTEGIISGMQKQMSVLPIPRLCHQKSWDLSTELCWEIAVLSTKKTADSLSWLGAIVRSNGNGVNTRAKSLQCYNPTAIPQFIKRDTDLEKRWSVAEHPAIPDLKKSTTSSDQRVEENWSLWTGLSVLLHKGLLGGTSMTVLCTSKGQEVHQFSCTQKDTHTKKINLLPIGLQQAAIQQQQSFTKGVAQVRHTNIYIWAQTLVENGWQTSGSIQFPRWNTSLEIVESVQFGEVERVYDIEVEGNHNFVANGLCVHNCHMLSGAAFNALLKTLEEPPERVVFVLATTDPQRVLPTIISRCQRFDFRRIALDKMVAHLNTIAAKEDISITPEAVTLVAQVAQGGLRDAESLLDQLSLLSGQVTVERVWDLVGSVAEPDLLELLEAIAQNNPEVVLDCSRRVMDRGREPLTFLQNLASFYRDLLIAKTAPTRSDLVTVTPATWQALCELAKIWDFSSILTGQQHLAKSEVQIKNTTQPRLWLEVTLLGLLPAARITPENDEGQHIVNITKPQQRINSNGSSQAPQIPSVPATSKQESYPLQRENYIKSDEPHQEAQTVLSNQQTEASNSGEQRSEEVEEQTQSKISSPEPADIETTSAASQSPTEVNSAVEISKEEIWQQVLTHLQPISAREMLRQMGKLVEFNGTLVRIGMKSQAWCNQAKTYVPNIKAAFQATFKSEVQVNLELAKSTQAKTAVNQPQAPTTVDNTKTNSALSTLEASQSKVTTDNQAQALTDQPQTSTEVSAKVDVAPDTSTTTADWDDDEVAIAAQSLAQRFKGEVVTLKDYPISSQPVTQEMPLQTDSDWDADAEEEADIDDF